MGISIFCKCPFSKLIHHAKPKYRKKMKKLLSITFLLLFSLCAFCAPIKIMSFNLCGSEKKSNYQNDSMWADEIIKIIKDSKADIVLMQEISVPVDKRTEYFSVPKKNNVLDYFTRKLSGFNGNWKYFSSAEYQLRKEKKINDQTYSKATANQTNAILYNSSMLNAVDKAKELGFTDFSGKYLFDKNNAQVIEFTEIKTKNKLNVINVHLPYNNLKNHERDLKTLESLYEKLKFKSATVIGGDFNTWRVNLTNQNFDNVDGTTSWYYDKKAGIKTTVNENKKSFCFSNQFDHFIYNNKIKVVQIMKRVGIQSQSDTFSSIKIGNHTYYNSKEYSDRISDHFPIIIEIDFE